MSPEHLVENCMADDVVLSRSEWNALLAAASRLTYPDVDCLDAQ
jgi:hypothetical protein